MLIYLEIKLSRTAKFNTGTKLKMLRILKFKLQIESIAFSIKNYF